jgi:hypothetical protein
VKSIILAIALVLGGCAAQTSNDAETAPASSEESDLKKGTTLKNGASRTIDNGPESLRVTASAANAKAKVTDSSLATCDIKVESSTAHSTTFSIAIDYERDDGWNGCSIEFTATGYKSTLDVGFNIDG